MDIKENKKLLFQENIPLAPFTSFGIGGPARLFYEARSDRDIMMAIQKAKDEKLPYFILGGGTNLLISDRGFQGLVIRMKNNHFVFHDMMVDCGAAALLQELIDKTIEKGFSGLEMMSGIGGTVGGAIRGNAGAFGQSIGERVKEITALINAGLKNFSRDECGFQYRDSIFKRNGGVILSARIQFIPGVKNDLRKKADDIILRRQERYNVHWQCAGCVFKNVDLSSVDVDEKKVIKALDITQEEYREVTKYRKVPVSFIVDKLGLKGMKVGGAKIAEEHGAFILNNGNATSEDVIMLMAIIKTKVRNMLGIQLEPEIELVGF